MNTLGMTNRVSGFVWVLSYEKLSKKKINTDLLRGVIPDEKVTKAKHAWSVHNDKQQVVLYFDKNRVEIHAAGLDNVAFSVVTIGTALEMCGCKLTSYGINVSAHIVFDAPVDHSVPLKMFLAYIQLLLGKRVFDGGVVNAKYEHNGVKYSHDVEVTKDRLEWNSHLNAHYETNQLPSFEKIRQQHDDVMLESGAIWATMVEFDDTDTEAQP